MWIALIASFICLLIAVLLFTPLFKKLPLYTPIALFFLFEGVWTLVNYLVLQLSPNDSAMQYIHYAGIIVFGGYLILCLFYSRPKANSKNETKTEKKAKTSNRRRKRN